MTPARRERSGFNLASRGPADLRAYWTAATRPLHVLVFLLPLIVLYEVGSAVYLVGDDALAAETVRAYRMLAQVLGDLGVHGVYLPGILLVVVLLVWQFLSDDPWRVRPRILGGMAIESVAWTLPLLVLGGILARLLADAPPAFAGTPTPFAEMSLPARATVAIGAGVYEELLFRFVAISLFHLILVDVLTIGERWGSVLAVTASAVCFALYHDVSGPAGFDWGSAVYYLFAGLFFGALFAARGLGIVVAVHALYDLAVLLALDPPPAGATA